jgi:hypothetical protein
VGGEVSRLGCLERYEEQKEDAGYGLWTSLESHNKTYNNLPETVRLAERRLDGLVICNRAGKTLYRSVGEEGKEKIRAQTKLPHNAARAVIMKERSRSLSQEERRSIDEGRVKVLEKMKRRGAPPEEITQAMVMLGNVRQLRKELAALEGGE